MGRTNAIILAIGLLACVAMAVMMQHLVGVADRHRPPEAVAAELDRILGRRLSAPSAYADAKIGGQPVAFLTIHPAAGIEPQELAAEAGAHLWRRRDGLAAVVVDCARDGVVTQRFQVPAPTEGSTAPVLVESPAPAPAPRRPDPSTRIVPPAQPR